MTYWVYHKWFQNRKIFFFPTIVQIYEKQMHKGTVVSPRPSWRALCLLQWTAWAKAGRRDTGFFSDFKLFGGLLEHNTPFF